MSAQGELTYKQAQKTLSERGEVYFSFKYPDSDHKYLLKKVSVEKVDGGMVYAYANAVEFESVYPFLAGTQIIESPSLKYPPRMAASLKEVQAWDFYPTYGQYVAMMDSFANAHPGLCRKEVIGNTTNGRELIILKISDNVNQKEAEPEFLYTSTMHGDELTGAILLLRLTDYLLNNYGSDAEVTEMVNNTEIWINPMANPDGTYFFGNNSVASAIRYNGNLVDLNRNFPDPQDGQHPDGNDWQPETLAWMQFMAQHNFVMSANFHGGAELMNYPWDTYAQLHADDNWMQFVSREFADTVQFYGPAGYFNDENNGITNGNAWYEIDGGRQDYANYFHHCREICIEISADKKPAASELPGFWDADFRSLINYIKQVQYGVHGIVTDSLTGEPLKAFIEVLQHDIDSSQIYTCDTINGNYHRLIKGGVYNMQFSSPGYISKTINNVSVNDYFKTILDVRLIKNIQMIANNKQDEIKIYPNPFNSTLILNNLPQEDVLVKVSDMSGRLVSIKFINESACELDLSDIEKGIYVLEIRGTNVFRFIVEKE